MRIHRYTRVFVFAGRMKRRTCITWSGRLVIESLRIPWALEDYTPTNYTLVKVDGVCHSQKVFFFVKGRDKQRHTWEWRSPSSFGITFWRQRDPKLQTTIDITLDLFKLIFLIFFTMVHQHISPLNHHLGNMFFTFFQPPKLWQISVTLRSTPIFRGPRWWWDVRGWKSEKNQWPRHPSKSLQLWPIGSMYDIFTYMNGWFLW